SDLAHLTLLYTLCRISGVIKTGGKASSVMTSGRWNTLLGARTAPAGEPYPSWRLIASTGRAETGRCGAPSLLGKGPPAGAAFAKSQRVPPQPPPLRRGGFRRPRRVFDLRCPHAIEA